MQITNSRASPICAVPNAASTNVAGTAVPSALDSRDSSKSVDFSKITPRKLQAYLDERLMSGHVDGPDGLYCSTLFSAIPGELYAEQPDVPVDLTETIKSMSDFSRNHGESKLVSLYNGLSDWMKMMEAQSVRISVVA